MSVVEDQQAERFGEASVRYCLRIVAITAFAVIAGQLIGLIYSGPTPDIINSFVLLFAAAVVFSSLAAALGYVLWLALRGEGHPLSRMRMVVAGSRDALVDRIVPTLAVFIFLGAFGSFKAMIPNVIPFWADSLLSNADRVLFGTDPWRITHALIGPFGTRFLDIMYGVWFPAWGFTLVYFGCFAKLPEQRRFITAFLLVWIIEGIVLATLLSSVGPCFLGLIRHPYAVRYDMFPIDAPEAARSQAILAGAFMNHHVGIFEGISAMPSVHVGVSALLVMSAWKNRFWLAAALLFWAAIMVASVHLGWHYAADGIVASLASALIWYLVGKQSRDHRPLVRSGLRLGTA